METSERIIVRVLKYDGTEYRRWPARLDRGHHGARPRLQLRREVDTQEGSVRGDHVAVLNDLSGDVRAVMTYLVKRKDVDPKRIALIGYGEGGWIALATAGKDSRVAALGLVGTPVHFVIRARKGMKKRER